MKKGCIAKVLVVNRDDHALVLHIGEHTKYPELSYLPDLPGGIVEGDETPTAGAIRELQEETGIVATIDDMYEVYQRTDVVFDGAYEMTRSLWLMRVDQPTITLSYEHESYKWTSLDELWHTEFHSLYFDDFIDEAFQKLRDEALLG